MKKSFIIFAVLLISFIRLPAQYTNTTIYTPRFTAVEGKILTSADLSDATKAQWKSDILAAYPNVTFLSDATLTYNCHGYAWHIFEGQSPVVWVNYIDDSFNPNIDNYWTDGSYIQVCNSSDADKVHYFTGDHSATASIVVSGKYESKWGPNIRVRHDLTYIPPDYNPSDRHYYVSTKVNGSTSNFCQGTRTFSVKSFTGASYSWTCSSTLTISGASNTNQLVVQRNGSSTGAAWVEVVITSSCSTPTVTRHVDFSVGTAPSVTCQEIGNGNCNQLNFLCQSQLEGWKYINIPGSWGDAATGYHLQANGGGYFNNGLTTQDITAGYFSIYVPSGGNNVTVWAMNSCGVSQNVPYVVVHALKSWGCGGFRIAPNPAVNTITISTNPENLMAAKINAGSSFTGIEIIDKMGSVKKKYQYPKGTKTVTIDVSALPTDNYIVRIFNGTSWEDYKILVAK